MEAQQKDRRPHSRACGALAHEHGMEFCARDCPTCGGGPDPATMTNPIAVPQMNGGATQYVEGPPLDPPTGLAAPATALVQVNVGPLGHGTVVVNGQDASRHVEEVHLSVQARKGTHIALVMSQGSDFAFEGPGIVEVTRQAAPGEQGEPWTNPAARWVDQLDPAALQALVAEGSMGVGIGQAVKNVLLDMLAQADGDA